MDGLTELTVTRAHQIFAHAAPARLNTIMTNHGWPIFDEDPHRLCCTLGRLKATPTHSVTQSAPTEPWSVVEVDLQGKFSPPSLQGSQYAMDFAWRDPPHLTGALLARKSDAAAELHTFAVAMRRLHRCPKTIRADLGGEFDNDAFIKAAAAEGMHVEFVVPERHVNSAELAHLRAADVMRANNAMVHGVLHGKFWGYSMLYAYQQIEAAGGWLDDPADLRSYAPYGSVIAYLNRQNA
ncbi:MAG: hypothetical protein AAGG50_20690, partial [Bacteroidota bacterium]